jgi:threonine dehydrogenase-like Zn-dependent dehydrogenase
VLACCRAVVEGGEVVLVGWPSKQRTDLPAQAITDVVFHRYLKLRSGWEWELPMHADRFRPASIFGNHEAALGWLAEGRVSVDGLARRSDPIDVAGAYAQLSARAHPLTFWLDWGSG